MLSPQELIGQKVWLSLESDYPYGEVEPVQVQAEITQPTSPPWFFARYLNPPASVRATGQWISLLDAQQAVLLHPVIEYDDYLEDEEEEDYNGEFDLPPDDSDHFDNYRDELNFY